MFRLTKELGYQHVADFLADQTSTELSDWIEYERMDSERQVNMVTHAIVKAFQPAQKTNKVVDDDEEIIDTTKPGFTEQFQGFSNSNTAKQPRRMPNRGTEVLRG